MAIMAILVNVSKKIEPGFKPHSKLNQDIWNGEDLNEEVAEALHRIANEFYESLELKGVKLIDVRFTGSLANYNYHPRSDIDLHLIINFKDVNKDTKLVKKYFDKVRTNWNNDHSIKIKGHEVEIYLEDYSETHVSSGLYSLTQDKWLTRPTKKITGLDLFSANKKADSIKRSIDSILSMKATEQKIKDLERIKGKVRRMRTLGLSKTEREYSMENIAFKILRSKGYLDKLSRELKRTYDKTRSLRNE